MKNSIFALILCLASCQASTPHVDVFYGARAFDNSSSWEQTNVQTVVGAQVNYAGKDGIGLEVGVDNAKKTSHDDTYLGRSVDAADTTVNELTIGLRKAWMLNDSFQAYVDGGMSGFMVRSEVDLTYASNAPHSSDIGYAPYAGGGINYFFNEHLSTGVMYRHNFFNTTADIFGANPDLDCDTVALTLGWSF